MIRVNDLELEGRFVEGFHEVANSLVIEIRESDIIHGFDDKWVFFVQFLRCLLLSIG